jgi:SAM-dependent methyltransferase
MSKVLRQCRKPAGWLGRVTARGMNRSHSELTDWGLRHVSIAQDATILDVGCGGGGTVKKLAGIAIRGKVYGIDYSEESVAVSRRTNRRLLAAGAVDIRHASVSAMPFRDGMFDLVTAVETHYFWPDLANDLREVRRVLRRGGSLLIVGGEYKGGKYDERDARWAELGAMARHTPDELRQLLSDAGYAEAEVFEEYDRGWICGLARRPSPAPDERGGARA